MGRPPFLFLAIITHQPSSKPPDHRHLAALLAFGHGSRVAAAACVSTLVARLHSTRDPAVTLKSLLALYHLLARGAFILCDQLPPALLRQSASGRNPLAKNSMSSLAGQKFFAFGHGSRVAAAACVSALVARLHSTRDPAVTLKSLLALHHLLARGAFILRDQLPPALLRQSASDRNPSREIL